MMVEEEEEMAIDEAANADGPEIATTKTTATRPIIPTSF